MKSINLLNYSIVDVTINRKKLQLLLTVLFVCFFATNIFAQDDDNQLVTQVNIPILYPGFSVETPISEKFTVFGKIGLGLGLSATNFPDGEYQVGYAIAPAYNVQGRYYYNGVKSETRKGNLLFSNSGNYAFVQIAGNLSPFATNTDTNSLFERDPVHRIGLGWGFQRVYKSNFLISWGIGVGYQSTGNISPISELTLGITLNKK